MERKLAGGMSSYYLRYKSGGKWMKESCKDERGEVIHTIDASMPYAADINREAKALLQALKAQKMLELSTGKERQHIHNSKALLLDYANAYYESKETYKGRDIIHCMIQALRGFRPDARLCEVTAEWCREFQDFLKHKKVNRKRGANSTFEIKTLADATIDSYMTQFRSMLESALNNNYIAFDKNPISKLGKDRVKAKGHNIDYLTSEELARVEASDLKNEQVHNMFLVGCFTGLRYIDIEDLRWEHIRQGEQCLMISKKLIKTGVDVNIPLNKRALAAIGERPAEAAGTDYVFAKKYNVTSIEYQVNKMREAAGIERKITFHISRHTFASLMLSKGVGIAEIKELLGHKSISTTMIYLTLDTSAKVKAVNVLDDL